MTKEGDEIKKYITTLAGYARGHYRNWSIDDLEREMAQVEYHIASMAEKDPNNPNIVMLRDGLLLMQMARGKGKVM